MRGSVELDGGAGGQHAAAGESSVGGVRELGASEEKLGGMVCRPGSPRWRPATMARGGARCARGSSAGALAESCPEVSPW